MFVVMGRNDEEIEAAAKATRGQIAFYGSTPSYRPVLEMHGWGGLQDELNAMSKQGRWGEMGDLVTDEMLHTFAVVGTPEEAVRGLKERWGDVLARLSFYAPYGYDADQLTDLLSVLKDPSGS
jgi:alkanesulfonate monooxygenase SsuD/methylene tetrahydromethanopterin reductase-like flavin-dependent oxidoreductase (luciferase family)